MEPVAQLHSLAQLRRARIEEILELRHALLRPGFPEDSARFEGDDATDTAHFGAFRNEELVCCLSLLPSTWQGRSAVQLRGMATRAHVQGQGLGSCLLGFALQTMGLNTSSSKPVWCNARVSAVPFYLSQGFVVVSDVFEIPDVGPHQKMQLAQPSSAIKG